MIPAQQDNVAREAQLQQQHLDQGHHRLGAAVKVVTQEGDYRQGVPLQQLLSLANAAHRIGTS
jgi:hypothetical protein